MEPSQPPPPSPLMSPDWQSGSLLHSSSFPKLVIYLNLDTGNNSFNSDRRHYAVSLWKTFQTVKTTRLNTLAAAELMPLNNPDRLDVIQTNTGVLKSEHESCYQAGVKANSSATLSYWWLPWNWFNRTRPEFLSDGRKTVISFKVLKWKIGYCVTCLFLPPQEQEKSELMDFYAKKALLTESQITACT